MILLFSLPFLFGGRVWREECVALVRLVWMLKLWPTTLLSDTLHVLIRSVGHLLSLPSPASIARSSSQPHLSYVLPKSHVLAFICN